MNSADRDEKKDLSDPQEAARCLQDLDLELCRRPPEAVKACSIPDKTERFVQALRTVAQNPAVMIFRECTGSVFSHGRDQPTYGEIPQSHILLGLFRKLAFSPIQIAEVEQLAFAAAFHPEFIRVIDGSGSLGLGNHKSNYCQLVYGYLELLYAAKARSIVRPDTPH